MLAGDVISDARAILNEPNPNGRWSPPTLLSLLSIAVKEVTRDILFPLSSAWFNTIAGVQEYQIPEIIRIYQCYYAGELLPRTDTMTLEGYQTQMYDNTAQGGGPSGSVGTNASAPTVYQTTVAPQWSAAGSEAAPGDGGATSFAFDGSQPWYPGRRPVFYSNGGNLGLVPAPAGVVPVMIRCVRQPAQITTDGQTLSLPDVARQCLMWRVVNLAYLSDRGQEAQALRQNADAMFQKELSELRHWRQTFDGTNRGVNMLTQRGAQGFIGQNRIGSGRS